jgi:hypothetical protein
LKKYGSLFPGIEFGAAYKILQRIYKFGGQPYVNSYMLNNFTSPFKSAFGERNYKTMIYAVSGSIMGVGEILLLPLDVLKIKAQTNADAFKGRGFIKIITDEGFNLYRYCIAVCFLEMQMIYILRGASWTAARNAPGMDCNSQTF